MVDSELSVKVNVYKTTEDPWTDMARMNIRNSKAEIRIDFLYMSELDIVKNMHINLLCYEHNEDGISSMEIERVTLLNERYTTTSMGQLENIDLYTRLKWLTQYKSVILENLPEKLKETFNTIIFLSKF